MNCYDVLVIGGGPVGSWVAYRLAGRGYRVAVLEQRKEPGKPTCCTGIVGRECVERFGIPPEIAEREASSACFFSPSGKSLRVQREEVQAYVLNRPALDSYLARQAQQAGADYFFSCPVEEAVASAGRVEARSRKGYFIGRALVLATGAELRLLAKLGLKNGNALALGAQVEVETNVEEVEVYFGREFAPGFFAWLVPLSGGRGLAGLLARRSPRPYFKRFLEHLASQGKLSVVGEASFRAISLSPLLQTYGDGLLVVGTAAGQVKPTTGGGIYFGLLAAEAAVETLERAFSAGDLSRKGLAPYERAWRKKLGPELQVGRLARKWFEALSDSQIERVFEFVARRRLHELLLRSPQLSFDWHSKALLIGLRHLIAGGLHLPNLKRVKFPTPELRR